MMKNTRINRFARLCSLAIALFCIGINASADDGVILTLKDGQELRFLFSKKPRISHGRELTIVASDTTSVSYDYSLVRSIRFDESATTAINDIKGEDNAVISFKVVDGTLYVYGLPVGESVSIYTVSGQRIAMKRQANSESVLSLPLTSQGVLVVSTSTGISYRVLNP